MWLFLWSACWSLIQLSDPPRVECSEFRGVCGLLYTYLQVYLYIIHQRQTHIQPTTEQTTVESLDSVMWSVSYCVYRRVLIWCCYDTSLSVLQWIWKWWLVFLSNISDWIMFPCCIFIQVTSPAWSKQTCWTPLWPVWSLSTQSTSKAYGSLASSPRTPRWGPSTGATEMYIKFQWCPSYLSSASVSSDVWEVSTESLLRQTIWENIHDEGFCVHSIDFTTNNLDTS